MSKAFCDDRYNESFRTGVKLVIARDIWNKMKKEIANRIGLKFPIEHGKAFRVAAELYHSRSDYSRYENGGMPDKAVYTAMTLLNWKAQDLDELPTVEDRAFGGFQYAIYKIRGGRSSFPRREELVDPIVFNLVKALLLHFVETGIDTQSLTERDLSELKNKFAPTMPGPPEDLMNLFKTYSADVADAIDGVSFEWASENNS